MKLLLTALFLFANNLCFAQNQRAAERVFIDLPQGIRSEDIFIRYQIVTSKGADSDYVRPQPGIRQYSFPVATPFGAKPELANVVLYARGCQFKIYVLDVSKLPNPVKMFQCDPLPVRHVSATIPVNEIPKNFVQQVDRLIVTASLENNWTCDYFLRPRPDIKNIMMGSCLGLSIPLGQVGVLDPANGGSFEIEIPDFSRDPTSREFGTAQYGQITLVLKDRFGQTRAVLGRQDGTAPLDLGLRIAQSYPEPIAFTTKHK